MPLVEITPISHPPGKAAPIFENYEYKIPEHTTIELDRYVDRLEAQKLGRLVGPVDFSKEINRAAIVASLPKDISEHLFTDIVMLALLTESATNSYAIAFNESSDKYHAPWLKRFINNVWVPDEWEHADPFKWILLNFGYAEEDLNRRVRITQEATYEHNSGSTPVHFTTFGSEQEYMTTDWHGIIHSLLKPGAPLAAKRVKDVQGREAIHTRWYSDLTLIQVSGNSELVHYVAETTSRFSMPQNHLDPSLRELQESTRYLVFENNRGVTLERDLMRIINYSLGDSAPLFGEFTLDLLSRLKGSEQMLSAVAAITKVPLLGDALTTFVAHGAFEREGIKHDAKGPEKLFRATTSPLIPAFLSRIEKYKLN